MSGKGDTQRPRAVSYQEYADNYEKAFRQSFEGQTWYACERHGVGMNSRTPCPACQQEEHSNEKVN